MTLKEFRELTKDLPDHTELVGYNAYWGDQFDLPAPSIEQRYRAVHPRVSQPNWVTAPEDGRGWITEKTPTPVLYWENL